MAVPTTWFDIKHDGNFESASAEEALKIVASDDRVRQAVQDALDNRNANKDTPGWGGPTAAQAVRHAIIEVLSED